MVVIKEISSDNEAEEKLPANPEIPSDNEAGEKIPAKPEFSSDNETEKLPAKPEFIGSEILFMIPAKIDRISNLPDCLLQLILSYLPTTKQAIRTQLLSKRWRHQWASVPILILHSHGMGPVHFLDFLQQTLSRHAANRLQRFEVIYGESAMDFELEWRVRHALNRHVKELVLHFFQNPHDHSVMPQFFYTEPQGFVKLDLAGCLFDFKETPNWPNLKELKLNCSIYRNVAHLIADLLKGCPSLDTLQLIGPFFDQNDVLSFPLLKKLVLIDCGASGGQDGISISCPDLQSLCVRISEDCPLLAPVLPRQVLCHNLMQLSIIIFELPGVEFPTLGVDGMMDASPFLQSLELDNLNTSPLLQLSSNTLKQLILGKLPLTTEVQVSCPQLHESDLCAFQAASSLEMEILGQLSHVEVLGIGRRFVEHGGQPTPLDCRVLTVEGSHFEDMLPGIISTVNSCVKLEKLTVKLVPGISLANNSNEACYDWVAPNLKMMKLVGLSEQLVFEFMEFVLQKSPALDTVILVVDKSDISFVFQASNKLISYQRAYPLVRFEIGYL